MKYCKSKLTERNKGLKLQVRWRQHVGKHIDGKSGTTGRQATERKHRTKHMSFSKPYTTLVHTDFTHHLVYKTKTKLNNWQYMNNIQMWETSGKKFNIQRTSLPHIVYPIMQWSTLAEASHSGHVTSFELWLSIITSTWNTMY